QDRGAHHRPQDGHGRIERRAVPAPRARADVLPGAVRGPHGDRPMSGVDPFAVRDLLGPDAAVCRRAVTGEHGIARPPLHNHHVHTHLVDVADMPAGGIAAVVDLGGDPVVLARQSARALPRLAYAGAFLTAPGGYPSGRVWAPDTILREVVGGGAVGTA